MTGLKMAEKAGSSETVAVEVGKTTGAERRRSVLIGLVASLATALVFAAILFGVVFYFQKRLDDKREWISWTRRSGNIDVHETVLLDEEKQTVLIVSAEAYRIGRDNSMTLHDFNTGYVAIRDLERNICFVSHVKYPDFSYARKKLQSRQGKNLDSQPVEHAVARPVNMTAAELGPTLSQFCEGVPAVWYDVTSKSGINKRRTSTDKPKTPCLHLDIKIVTKYCTIEVCIIVC